MFTTPSPVRPATHHRARRLSAALAGVVLSIVAVGSAAAITPPGSVSVSTDGCSFTVTIDLDQGWPVIAWEVKQYTSHWQDGKTVLQDSVTDDADGHVVAGPYTLPAGHYNVAVDNEPVDSSSIVEDFTLSCPTATPSGSELPIGSQSASPSESAATPTPTGQDLPIEGTAQPTGNELGAVGVGAVTPPPTDTGSAASSATETSGGWLMFAVLAIIATALLSLSNHRLSRVRATDGRGRRR